MVGGGGAGDSSSSPYLRVLAILLSRTTGEELLLFDDKVVAVGEFGMDLLFCFCCCFDFPLPMLLVLSCGSEFVVDDGSSDCEFLFVALDLLSSHGCETDLLLFFLLLIIPFALFALLLSDVEDFTLLELDKEEENEDADFDETNTEKSRGFVGFDDR